MLLLAIEHIGEAQAFIDHFQAKKDSGVFVSDGIVIYVNFGKGGLSLALSLARLYERFLPSLTILFGTAGNLSNLKIGEVVIIEKTKLLDSSLNPVFNPIELNKASGFKNVDCVTVLGNYALNKDLSYFADCIDMEAYFFAKALKELQIKGLIIKLISDNNDKKITKQTKIDYTQAIESIELFKTIANNGLSEIFIHTHFTDLKVLFGLAKLFSQKHYTFTMRQNMYKKIVINTAKIVKKPFKLKYVFCENSIQEIGTCGIKINDYVSFFHNLKDKCALIFASKKGELLRKTPNHYTPSSTYGYSILYSYNCIYDCSYCFLKGYFKTFNPVIFKNIHDFFKAIEKTVDEDRLRPLYFYLSTFSDPIALSVFDDSYIKFAKFFENIDAILEIRTKSAKVEKLLAQKPFKNTIIAFSLSPQSIIDKYEPYAPSLKRRIKAIKLLDEAGFNIGIRFDPFFLSYANEYLEWEIFLHQIKHLHSIEIGVLRFSKNEYKTFLRKNPVLLSNVILDKDTYRYNISNLKQTVETLFFNFKDKIYYNMLF